MALRSGYKGFKKLLGLKTIRPGTLAVDDAALANTFFPRSEQAMLGAKNVAIGAFSSSSVEGVAFTANSDNTVGVVAGSTHVQHQVNSTQFIASTSGMFKYLGGIANEAVLFCWDTTTNSRPYTSPSKTTAQSNNSKGKEDAIPFYMEEGHVYQLICRVSANVEVTGTFYPMIICETDTDLSYTAPAMTNKELTEKVTVDKSLDGTISATYCNTETSIISIVKQGNVVQLTGSIVVTTEIPSYTVFISDLPKLAVPSNGGNSRAYNFTIFGTGTYYRVYLDASGKIAPHSVPIPTGSYTIGITYIAES